jgi:hypothetical protein
VQAGLGVADPDLRGQVDEELLTHLDEDWELACEIPKHAEAIGRGWPHCKGHPAQWVAWFAGCCSARPRHMLMCTDCKDVYDRWVAWQAAIVCGWCDQETGGPVAYTRLNKEKA